MARTKKTIEPEIIEVETPVEQTPDVDQVVAAPKAKAQREELKAQGLKRCPTHDHYLDRLADPFKQIVDGQTDPSIRPLSEFSANVSACRECARLRNADRRAATHTGPSQVETRLERLINKRDALNEQIAKLQEQHA
jgi:hypothetical protein